MSNSTPGTTSSNPTCSRAKCKTQISPLATVITHRCNSSLPPSSSRIKLVLLIIRSATQWTLSPLPMSSCPKEWSQVRRNSRTSVRLSAAAAARRRRSRVPPLRSFRKRRKTRSLRCQPRAGPRNSSSTTAAN